MALILGQLAGGVTHDEPEREYGIDAAGVKAALGYAAHVVADEVIYVAQP